MSAEAITMDTDVYGAGAPVLPTLDFSEAATRGRLVSAATAKYAEEGSLEADGCDFLEAMNFYLARLGCPDDARLFVAYVVGYTGGSPEAIEIRDAEISKRGGCSTKTIQRWRKSLTRWQMQSKARVMEIFEGRFDREEKKNKPTRYRILVTEVAADIVRKAREKRDLGLDYRKALEDEATRAAQDSELPAGLVHRRGTRWTGFHKQVEGRRRSALTHLMKIFHLHLTNYYQRNDDYVRGEVRDFWNLFRDDAELVMEEVLSRLGPDDGGD